MRPFDRKEKEAQKIWDTLSGKVDYDKMLEDAVIGIQHPSKERREEGERLMQKYINQKIDNIANQVTEDENT